MPTSAISLLRLHGKPGAWEEYMRGQRVPKVSLGLPVFNGERFVRHAIESMLAQTFKDFELIISDNASDDGTQAICEEFAAKDSRVRYFRQEINTGAKSNFNRVFEYSRGKYFKWVAADDVCGPRYLELTVAELEKDPGVVLAHTESRTINGEGEIVSPEEMAKRFIYDEGIPVRVYPADRERHIDDPRAHARFREVLLGTRWCFEIFALIRREAMLLTYPKGDFYGSDKVMLAQLSLLGRFVQVPDLQFFRRAHHGNSTNMSVKERERWSRAARNRPKLPTQFPCFSGYIRAAISLPPELSERAKCLRVVAQFALRPNRYRNLASELASFVRKRRVQTKFLSAWSTQTSNSTTQSH